MSADNAPVRLHLDKRASQILKIDSDADPDELLTTEQQATWLGVSRSWLEELRAKNMGPPSIKLGPRVVRYRRGATRQWLLERERRFDEAEVRAPRIP